jgi:thiamine biosynthesis lipoprotein
MGTHYRIRIQHAPVGVYLPKLKRTIEQVLEMTQALMSTYRADSEISNFNASATSRWQNVSAGTARVVQTALRVQRESNGAFDPAAAPLVDYWGFGPMPGPYDRAAGLVPPELLTRVAGAKIELRAGRMRKHHKGAALDLNAIAKGDALDGVAGVLERAGVTDYLVEIGGEIRAKGAGPGGAGWRIGLDNPGGGVRPIIRLHGKAVATSGDYVDYFMRDGKRYCHILDPRTGRPVEHGLSMVSVVADSAIEADAWATALLVMGPDKGVRHAMRNAMAVLFVRRERDEFLEFATPAFQRLRLDNKEAAS